MRNLIFAFALPCLSCTSESIEIVSSYDNTAFLKSHNILRNAYGYESLRTDVALLKHAEAWAAHLASECRGVFYSNGSGYAENIHISYGLRRLSALQVVSRWDIDNKFLSVGCAVSTCEDYSRSLAVKWYYVCNYKTWSF